MEFKALDAYLSIILGRQEGVVPPETSQKEQVKVVKEAAVGLLALLEDDQTKLEVKLQCKCWHSKMTYRTEMCRWSQGMDA